MASYDSMVDRHYGSGGLMDRVLNGLDLAGKETGSLVVDDLAPIDAFHTRGRAATVELAGLAGLSNTDLVLDVGCGLGGTARHLAEEYGCRVEGIDLTNEYIEVGNQLNRMVGMTEKVNLRQGNALNTPFDEGRFDIAWTEHVQMNIADKKGFYSEIARVMKPGGRLLFHDVFRGSGDSPVYPMPWAEDESISFLATQSEARAAIEQAGLEIQSWTVKTAESIEFFKKVGARIAAEGTPPIGIHLLMGDNAPDKLQNYVVNMGEERATVVMGMAVKKS